MEPKETREGLFEVVEGRYGMGGGIAGGSPGGELVEGRWRDELNGVSCTTCVCARQRRTVPFESGGSGSLMASGSASGRKCGSAKVDGGWGARSRLGCRMRW
jgi:hypothetical protein